MIKHGEEGMSKSWDRPKSRPLVPNEPGCECKEKSSQRELEVPLQQNLWAFLSLLANLAVVHPTARTRPDARTAADALNTGDSVFPPPLDPDKWGPDPLPMLPALESVFLKLGWFLGPVEPWEGGLVSDLLLLGQYSIVFGDHKDQATRMGVNTLVWEILTLVGLRTRLRFWGTCGQAWAWATLWLSPRVFPLWNHSQCKHPGQQGCQWDVLYPMDTFLPRHCYPISPHGLQAMCQTIPWDGLACLLRGLGTIALQC